MDKAENSSKYIGPYDVLVSQSALEHIEADVEVLYTITERLSDLNQAFVQIHLVSASLSLFLYLWHGWRQYSKNKLASKSGRLEHAYGVKAYIVPLRGLRSFWAHLKFITIPYLLFSLIGSKQLNLSASSCNKMFNVIEDSVKANKRSNGRAALFWALVISSNEINIDAILKSSIRQKH